MQYTVPASIDVYVPKLDRSFPVDIGTASEEVILHILHHGLKQKLVDATAGINSKDFPTDEAYKAKLQEVIDARLDTILELPTARVGRAANPFEAECRTLVVAFLRTRTGAKAEAAREMASTFAKAREAFGLVIAKAVRSKSPTATDDQVAKVVDRTWNSQIVEKAERIVAERQAETDIDIEV